MCFRQLFRPKQGSTDRQVRGPIGPSWSEIFKNLLVLVRFGPRFLKIFWFWSGSVRDFQKIVGPGPVRSEIFKNVLVLVRFGPRFSKISLFTETAPVLDPVSGQNWAFSETAFSFNAELGRNRANYWNRIRFKCGIGQKLGYLLKPHPF